MATRTPMPRINRRGRYVLIGLVVVIALFIIGSWLTGIYTKFLWYDSVGYSGVYSTTLWTRIGMFVVFGVVLALWTSANLYATYRFRPDTIPHTPEQQNMERYRSMVEPRIGWWIGILGAVVGIFAGIAAMDHWQQWLMFSNAVDFHQTDPQFHIDIGFYVFRLPFWEYLVSVGFTMLIIGIVAALGGHYLYGALRLSGRGERITSAARWHLSVLIGAFVLLKAVAYFLDRYALTLEDNQSIGVTGGGYTEMTALLPAKGILIFVAVLAAVAVVVFSNYYARTLVIPGMALGLVLVSAIALGGVYPFVVSQVSTGPNAQDKESKYVQRTIDGTKAAYDLGDLHIKNPKITNDPKLSDLKDNAAGLGSLRMMDPSIVSDTFTQKQQAKGYHEFNQELDVDHFTNKDGQVQDYVVGVREINPDKVSNTQLWSARHTTYTHGYGLVSATGNRVCSNGPYFESGSLNDLKSNDSDDDSACKSDTDFSNVKLDKHGKNDAKIKHPQIYFGELDKDFAIVGVPKGAKPREYDRPASGTTSDKNAANGKEKTSGGDVYSTYKGGGGVPIGSFGRQLAYAWEFGDTNFMLSSRINSDSKLLYHRSPRDRVKQVAPFLTVDGDPYPTVVNGDIKWVMDCYTTSNSFPYSQRVNLQDATTDRTTGQGESQQADEPINYMRNSVKATVDAYTGKVDLYKFGGKDPVLDVWNKAYSGIVKPEKSIPKTLADHFRYPVDQFKVQRNLLQKYHVDSAGAFIDGSREWQIADDPVDSDKTLPPYYMVAKLPGQGGDPQFQLTSTFSPKNRDSSMSAMMSGRYDKDNNPVLTLYQFGSAQVYSTSQVYKNLTEQNTFASFRRDYSSNNYTFTWGNLLAVPVGHGMLYAEPVYITPKSSGSGTTLPLLQGLLVSYGGNNTFVRLDDKKNKDLIKDDSDAKPLEAAIGELTGTTVPDTNPGDGDSGNHGDNGKVSKAVQAALDKIDSARSDIKAAMKAQDYKALGEALDKLDKALDEYHKALKES